MLEPAATGVNGSVRPALSPTKTSSLWHHCNCQKRCQKRSVNPMTAPHARHCMNLPCDGGTHTGKCNSLPPGQRRHSLHSLSVLIQLPY